MLAADLLMGSASLEQHKMGREYSVRLGESPATISKLGNSHLVWHQDQLAEASAAYWCV